MKSQVLTKDNFSQVIADSTQPVLVDFWAEWCGPCKMLAPVIDEVATEQAGKAVVAKLNVDDAPDIASRYGIRAIPTLIIFKNGHPQRTLSGLQSKAVLTVALAAA